MLALTSIVASYRYFMARVSYDERSTTRILVALMTVATVNVVLGGVSVLGGPRLYPGRVLAIALFLSVIAVGFMFELPRERRNGWILAGSVVMLLLFLTRGLWDPPMP